MEERQVSLNTDRNGEEVVRIDMINEHTFSITITCA